MVFLLHNVAVHSYHVETNDAYADKSLVHNCSSKHLHVMQMFTLLPVNNG